MKSKSILLYMSLIINAHPLYAEVRNVCGTVGGFEYPIIHDANSQNSVSVHNINALQKALELGEKNIYIPGDVVIELPYVKDGLDIPDDVVIYSDRGVNGSEGALLKVDYMDEEQHYFPVISTGNNVKLTGMRIQGPVLNIDTNVLTIGVQNKIGTVGLVIENNEIYGWGGGAVSVKKGQNVLVRNNYIHHNRKKSRGYGVVVQNGNSSASIFCNVFDSNRHSIAGSGQEGESYTASYNVILEEGNGHSFDMHESSSSPGIGGQSIRVINNWFAFGGTKWGHYPSIIIRGIPLDGAVEITSNSFRSPFEYIDAGGRVKRAVEGVAGSIDTDLELQEKNDYSVPMVFRRSVDNCYLDILEPSQSIPVACQAISGYLN